MKKLIFTVTLYLVILHFSFSQVRFHWMIGVSPVIYPNNTDIILNRSSLVHQLRFNMNKIDLQLFTGAGAQMDISDFFFMETSLTYSKRTCTYFCKYINASVYHPEPYNTMNETEHLLILPINIGASFGPLSVTSGLSALTTLSKQSELSYMVGFSGDTKRVKMGWQSGVRFTFKNYTLGAEYQGQLYRIGKEMQLHNESMELRHVPGQFVFSLAYTLKNAFPQ